jgi:Flp pilus assembly protein TadG
MRTLTARRRRGLSNTKIGQSTVEFALVFPLFILLVFGVFDFGRLFFTQLTVQHAMREAGRFAVTGDRLPDPANPGRTLSRVDSIIQIARNAAVGIDVSAIQISSIEGGADGPGRAGGPSDMVTVSVTVDLKLITPVIAQFFGPNGVYRFTTATTFKNEPFPADQTI